MFVIRIVGKLFVEIRVGVSDFNVYYLVGLIFFYIESEFLVCSDDKYDELLVS